MDTRSNGSRRPSRVVSAVALGIVVLASACGGGDRSSPTGLSEGANPSGTPRESACPTYVDPSHCPPFSTAGIRTVTGVVRELMSSGRRPRAGSQVWLWIQMSTGGFRMKPALTDSTGAYRFAGVPDGTVVLLASADGFDQPCAATATTVNTNSTVDIDLVSQAQPLPAMATGSPTLSGMVFETTPNGRTPVAGAVVMFEWQADLVTAMTTTDAAGRYSLCSLPLGTGGISAAKASYALTDLAITIAGSAVLDLELKR
jgi:hypothetical protein